MRIATLCTLAFAICAERLKASEKEEEKTSRRWLAKSLLLGASVHAASGFGQPAHSARGFGRPARVHALEPLKSWGSEKVGEVRLKYIEVKRAQKAGETPRTIEKAELWAENAKRREGHELLAKIKHETSFHEDDAEKKVLEGDAREDWVREFKQWQVKARKLYLAYPGDVEHSGVVFSTPAGIRARELLQDAMNYPVTFNIVNRDAEKERSDAGKMAEWSEFLNEFLSAIRKY